MAQKRRSGVALAGYDPRDDPAANYQPFDFNNLGIDSKEID